MCMIRPRGGSFEYTEAEGRIMVDDLRHAAELGVDGVVFGCLRGGEVDRELTGRLAGLAKEAGLMVTFHMAFDEIARRRRLICSPSSALTACLRTAGRRARRSRETSSGCAGLPTTSPSAWGFYREEA